MLARMNWPEESDPVVPLPSSGDTGLPRISVIIPVHNGGRPFRGCLAALARSTRRADELIVVADGCTDDSAEVARRTGAQVVEIPGPAGPAAARNKGAALATGEILIFADADVAFHRDTIAQFESFLGQHPEFAAAFGNYDDSPAVRDPLSLYKNLLQHFVHLRAPEEAFSFWGACGAIRRDVFLEHGGFDESYKTPALVDLEWGYRLRGAGHRIAHRREILCKHLKRWTPRTLLVSDLWRRAVPWTVLNRRARQIPNGLNLGWPERLKVAAVWAGSLTLLAGWWDVRLLLVTLSLWALALMLNARFLIFLLQKGGIEAALIGSCWHLLYHWYCGLGFMLGHLSRVRP
jgi:glycosyltransferase involved in cell wall biosynthesis